MEFVSPTSSTFDFFKNQKGLHCGDNFVLRAVFYRVLFIFLFSATFDIFGHHSISFLQRGKFYPQLTNLVRINTPRAVQTESRKAFRKLPNIEAAVTTLCGLKGVGTTLASGVPSLHLSCLHDAACYVAACLHDAMLTFSFKFNVLHCSFVGSKRL